MTDQTCDHVIYHGGCVDGFTSAWLLARRFPDAMLHEGRYGEPPPSGLSGHVVIADFSYPPAQLVRLADTVGRVTIIDHHQTAIEAIDGYDGVLPANVACVLDQEHSGAWLVADWLGHVDSFRWPNPETTLAAYVEDRDLWQFVLPDSREITAYINATPMTLDDWDALSDDVEYDRDIVVRCGAAIGRRNRVLIDQLVATARDVEIEAPDGEIEGGKWLLRVPMVACPYGLGSDTAGELAVTSDWKIGGYYIDYPDRREFGLRSTDDGPDVAKIAEHYGGGGHRHASGFRVMRDSRHPLLTA